MHRLRRGRSWLAGNKKHAIVVHGHHAVGFSNVRWWHWIPFLLQHHVSRGANYIIVHSYIHAYIYSCFPLKWSYIYRTHVNTRILHHTMTTLETIPQSGSRCQAWQRAPRRSSAQWTAPRGCRQSDTATALWIITPIIAHTFEHWMRNTKVNEDAPRLEHLEYRLQCTAEQIFWLINESQTSK